MKKALTIGLLLVLAVLVLGAGTGCKQAVETAKEKAEEKVAEKVAEKSTGTEVDKDGDKTTITGGDGTTIEGGGNELPDGLPEDLPVYEGDVEDPGKIAGTEGTSYLFGISTDDDPKDVYDWYKGELASAGFRINADMVDGEGSEAEYILIFDKEAEKQNGSVDIKAESDGKTLVSTTFMVAK